MNSQLLLVVVWANSLWEEEQNSWRATFHKIETYFWLNCAPLISIYWNNKFFPPVKNTWRWKQLMNKQLSGLQAVPFADSQIINLLFGKYIYIKTSNYNKKGKAIVRWCRFVSDCLWKPEVKNDRSLMGWGVHTWYRDHRLQRSPSSLLALQLAQGKPLQTCLLWHSWGHQPLCPRLTVPLGILQRHQRMTANHLNTHQTTWDSHSHFQPTTCRHPALGRCSNCTLIFYQCCL